MAKNIDRKIFEIPSRKVEVARAHKNDFNYIKEVVVDYYTAQLLFFVKVSSRHYMEFLESTIL